MATPWEHRTADGHALKGHNKKMRGRGFAPSGQMPVRPPTQGVALGYPVLALSARTFAFAPPIQNIEELEKLAFISAD